MGRIVLPGESLGEIRVALPIRVQIAVIQAREAVKFRSAISGESAVLQRISVGMADDLSRRGIASEIAFAGRIAPRSFGVPVPGLHKQIGVLAVTDNAPTGGQCLLDLIWPEERVRSIARNTVHRR